MEISNDYNVISEIKSLIENRKNQIAEEKLSLLDKNSSIFHYLNSLILFSKAWYDSAKEEMEVALSLDSSNSEINSDYIKLMSRHRRYYDDYDRHGYHRHHDCDICCCDDCCCDTHFSCCDLLCLDQCCECMGGDLIDCI